MLSYAAMMCGFAYSGVEKCSGLLSTRHFARKTYMLYSTFIKEKTLEHVRDALNRSIEAVFRYYSEEIDRQPDVSGVLGVDVSFRRTSFSFISRFLISLVINIQVKISLLSSDRFG